MGGENVEKIQHGKSYRARGLAVDRGTLEMVKMVAGRSKQLLFGEILSRGWLLRKLESPQK